eukprot:16439442-Heterocapsa_arctica.AAC.1
MQAAKKDKHIKAQRQVMIYEEYADTQNLYAVANRRQQYQGYVDQKEDISIEQKRFDQTHENKQNYIYYRKTHSEAENNNQQSNNSDNIMDDEQQNISHNQKRAKTSDNSQT